MPRHPKETYAAPSPPRNSNGRRQSPDGRPLGPSQKTRHAPVSPPKAVAAPAPAPVRAAKPKAPTFTNEFTVGRPSPPPREMPHKNYPLPHNPPKSYPMPATPSKGYPMPAIPRNDLGHPPYTWGPVYDSGPADTPPAPNPPDSGGGNRYEVPKLDAGSVQVKAPSATKAEVTTSAPAQTVEAGQVNPASTAEVNTAEAGVSEYAGYDASQGNVSSTVEDRMTGLLSSDSAYMQRAQAAANQQSNARGMLNSSMAVGAAHGAAIDASLPIAQQDAQMIAEMDLANLGYTNEADRVNALANQDTSKFNAGLLTDTNKFNAGEGNATDQFNINTETDINKFNVTEENDTAAFNASEINATNKFNAEAENNAAKLYAGAMNDQEFGAYQADLDAQLMRMDSQLAAEVAALEAKWASDRNMDSINGNIVMQLYADMGTIIANSDDPEVASKMIATLLYSANATFEFSNGTDITPRPPEAGDPTPAPPPPPPSNGGGGGDSGGGDGEGGGYNGGGDDNGGGGNYGGGRGGSGGVGGGDGSGCFAKGTLFCMADGAYKVVEDIKVGDKVQGGTVLKTRTGLSSRDFYNYNGTIMTDEHFVLEDGTWKYVFEADRSELVDPFDTYYTMDTTNHRLYGVNGEVFSDDAVFDSDHPIHTKPYVKETWDEMLEILNGKAAQVNAANNQDDLPLYSDSLAEDMVAVG